MTEYIQRLERAYASFRQKTDFCPDVLLILGSGLGSLADGMQVVKTIPYGEIDGMPTSTVAGHAGRFLLGYVDGVKVAVMQGRIHYYEGYAPQECVMPIRLMALAGAKFMLLTNASGGITYPEIGTLMRITDHISLVPSPLRGENWDRLGKRFPDMTHPYDEELGKAIDDIAKQSGIRLEKGVYIQTAGPNLETVSEIKMAKLLGADAVGMSSAIEVISARHAGLRVGAIACIVNPACGIAKGTLDDIDESLAFAKSGEKLKTLIFKCISKIKEML